MINEALTAGVAMYVFVALKAWQTRNVAGLEYWPVIPTSLLMALGEVYVISVIVRVGYDLTIVLAIGLGAGLGCMTAMYLHQRIFSHGKSRKDKVKEARSSGGVG